MREASPDGPHATIEHGPRPDQSTTGRARPQTATVDSDGQAVFSLSRAGVRRVVAWAILGLSAANALAHFVRLTFQPERGNELIRLFRMDIETSLPTWFSSTLLLVAAGLLAWISIDRPRTEARAWLGLAAVFVALAMDEAAGMHEMLIGPTRRLLGLGGYFAFAWVIPGAVFVVILTAIYARHLLALPLATKRAFALAATLYLGGALGLELIGAQLYYGHGADSVASLAVASLEEMLELGGLAIFIDALLGYASSQRQLTQVRLGS